MIYLNYKTYTIFKRQLINFTVKVYLYFKIFKIKIK